MKGQEEGDFTGFMMWLLYGLIALVIVLAIYLALVKPLGV